MQPVANQQQPELAQLTDEQVKGELARIVESGRRNRYLRLLVAALGSVPWVGGLIAGAAGLTGEREQARASDLLRQWMEGHELAVHKLQLALVDIVTRLEALGDEAGERIQSDEYLALVRKGFRAWDASDTDEKRKLVQNLLSNAGATKICSDDVVRLFIDWIEKYHEIHFKVIREIYRHPGIGRGKIWDNIHAVRVREDSAEADLYRLLIRDLTTGGVIRQHRETTYDGEFMKKKARGRSSSPVMKSAFDDFDPYELTELGKQFVHYTMNEVVPRLGSA